LPAYLSGWDLALLLFARNEATRFISPTKTPEYLAAGKPVVSTSIRDVVTPYADRDLIHVADTVDDFVHACANALREVPEPRRVRADVFLRGTSWNRTWAKSAALLDAVTRQPSSPAVGATAASSPRLGV
jgi:UDP-galactopyranose mutase